MILLPNSSARTFQSSKQRTLTLHVNPNNTATPAIKFDKDFEYCKKLILHHCVNRPPHSHALFSFKQMNLITENLMNTFEQFNSRYFRHYTLYKHVFTKKLTMELIIENFNEKTNVPDQNAQDEAVKPDTATVGAIQNTESLQHLPSEELTIIQTTEPTKEELGLQELRELISSTLSGKMDEIRQSIQQKMLAQEDNIVSKLKKLNLGAEDDKKKARKK